MCADLLTEIRLESRYIYIDYVCAKASKRVFALRTLRCRVNKQMESQQSFDVESNKILVLDTRNKTNVERLKFISLMKKNDLFVG